MNNASICAKHTRCGNCIAAGCYWCKQQVYINHDTCEDEIEFERDAIAIAEISASITHLLSDQASGEWRVNSHFSELTHFWRVVQNERGFEVFYM